MKLGETVVYLRTLTGVSQRKTAALLGISVVHMNRIEKDITGISDSMMERFRKHFGVDLYVLAWCRNGDVRKLPPAVRKAALALKDSWQADIEKKLSV